MNCTPSPLPARCGGLGLGGRMARCRGALQDCGEAILEALAATAASRAAKPSTQPQSVPLKRILDFPQR